MTEIRIIKAQIAKMLQDTNIHTGFFDTTSFHVNPSSLEHKVKAALPDADENNITQCINEILRRSDIFRMCFQFDNPSNIAYNIQSQDYTKFFEFRDDYIQMNQA